MHLLRRDRGHIRLATWVGVVSFSALLSLSGCSQPIATEEPTNNQLPAGEPSNSPDAIRLTPNPIHQAETLTVEEQKFVGQMMKNSLAEVALGQLATRQATSNAVKQFAQRIVQNHTEINRQMAQFASAKAVTLPKDMGEKNQAVVQRLSTLSGTEFDRAYMNQMVDAHTRELDSLQQKAEKGQNADLKQLAASQIPLLQDHLQLAREIAQNLNR